MRAVALIPPACLPVHVPPLTLRHVRCAHQQTESNFPPHRSAVESSFVITLRNYFVKQLLNRPLSWLLGKNHFVLIERAHMYTSWAVQVHPDGGQSDFVWLSARTPHGGASYVWRA